VENYHVPYGETLLGDYRELLKCGGKLLFFGVLMGIIFVEKHLLG